MSQFQSYIDSLTSIEKSFYKTAVKIYSGMGYSETDAHQEGVNEVQSYHRKRKIHSKPQTWVDITTGKKIKAHI